MMLLLWMWMELRMRSWRGRSRTSKTQRIRIPLKTSSSRHLRHLPECFSSCSVEKVRSILSSAPVLPPSLLQEFRRQIHLKLRMTRRRSSCWGLWHRRWTWGGARSARCARSHGQTTGGRRHFQGGNVGCWMVVDVIVDMWWELLMSRWW